MKHVLWSSEQNVKLLDLGKHLSLNNFMSVKSLDRIN